MWPFKKKTLQSDAAENVENLDTSDSEDKYEINHQEIIDQLGLMSLFSKFSGNVGKQVFIRLPGTTSALCTTIEEAFAGQVSCYFTVSSSLHNLTTGGMYSGHGCKEKSFKGGNRIYFDSNWFWFLENGKKIQLNVETCIDPMVRDYVGYINSQIAIHQQHLDSET